MFKKIIKFFSLQLIIQTHFGKPPKAKAAKNPFIFAVVQGCAYCVIY